jgi:hypothetical protein
MDTLLDFLYSVSLWHHSSLLWCMNRHLGAQPLLHFTYIASFHLLYLSLSSFTLRYSFLFVLFDCRLIISF